jgi:glyoxylase-like metal-dependent hydrolase (beta-lactamase superfamily II)
MQMRFILNAVAVVFMLAACPATAQEKPLRVEVLRSGEGSLFANSTLIMGEKEAVLVDPPFTRADAYRLAAMVLESGKRLTYVFVTHDHPDHFFSMEVIQDIFPEAKIVADPIVVTDIWRSLPYKVKRWGPVLGRNGPIHPTAPLPLDGDTIMLEGREIKVLGPMAGDHVHATALWVPSIRTLVAGDLIFNQVFLWLGEHRPEDVTAWAASLDRLARLEPQTVVAGHSKPGLPNDITGLAFTRAYLAAWPKLVAASKDSKGLELRVRKAFPDAIDVLDNFILTNSAQVAKGEQEPWKE